METQRRASIGDVVASMFTAGALPAGLVAGLGDFFSPMGAWAAPLLAGAMALVVLVLFCAYRGLREAVLVKVLNRERAHLWAKPFFQSPVFWSLLVFAGAGIVFGSASRERRDEGGWLASNLDVVSELQTMTGIAERSLAVQEGTLAGVKQLVDIGQTGSASNPRVTLANRGVAWNAFGLDQALVERDMETVALFLQGGMAIDSAVAHPWKLARFFRTYSPEVAAVLVDQRVRIPDAACLPDGTGDSGFLADWLTDDDRLALYAEICDRPSVRDSLAQAAQEQEQRAVEVRKANESVRGDRRGCKVRLKREFPMEKAMALGFPPSIDGNLTTDAPEERVAAGLQVLLQRPGLDDATLIREYAALIESSCDESFFEQPVPEREGVYARALEAFQ